MIIDGHTEYTHLSGQPPIALPVLCTEISLLLPSSRSACLSSLFFSILSSTTLLQQQSLQISRQIIRIVRITSDLISHEHFFCSSLLQFVSLDSSCSFILPAFEYHVVVLRNETLVLLASFVLFFNVRCCIYVS